MTKSDQLAAWQGGFGNDYIERNLATDEAVHQRMLAWARILGAMQGRLPRSILEVGANVGRNLKALRLLTDAELYGLEPNAKAREKLVSDKVVSAECALDGAAQSIPLGDGAVELSFTSGVLIHIHPDDLEAACRELVRVSRSHVAVIEYFSDRPEAVEYRGRSDLLFKRDFGAYLLEIEPRLKVVDCGFFWRHATGLDNLTWWLLSK